MQRYRSLIIRKIKGAGSGIGRATARIFAREGAKIIAADRNVEAAKDTIKEIGSGMDL